MNATRESRPDLERPTITRIETLPIRVPLDRAYAGSHYGLAAPVTTARLTGGRPN